jgi:hypothetical protein
VFTARYGLIPYIKQITFRLLKVNFTRNTENPSVVCLDFEQTSVVVTSCVLFLDFEQTSVVVTSCVLFL